MGLTPHTYVQTFVQLIWSFIILKIFAQIIISYSNLWLTLKLLSQVIFYAPLGLSSDIKSKKQVKSWFCSGMQTQGVFLNSHIKTNSHANFEMGLKWTRK